MAFNAGSIEATLTLSRTPFTAGLRAARAEAKKWAEKSVDLPITPVIKNAALAALRERISKVRASIDVSLSLKNTELVAIRERLARVVGRIDVKLNLVAGEISALQARLRAISAPMVRVRLGIQAGEITALKARIASIDAAVGVRLNLSAAEIAALKARIRAIRSTINVDVDVNGGNGLGRMQSQMRMIMMTLPLLLPVAGSAVTSLIGLIGGLVSILGVAAVGFGALALVAVPTFKKIQDAVAAGQAEINKLPPGLREAANALKGLQTEYNKLVTATQGPVGLMMAAGFNAATAAIRPLKPLILDAAAAVTSIGKQMETYFNSAHYKGFVDFVGNNIGPVFQKLFDIMAFGTRAVMNLVVAFMPLGTWLLDNISAGMKEFATWTGTLASDPRFQGWLRLVEESLTAVWKFLVSVVQFLFNLSNALAPLGNVIMGVLTDVFNALSRMPPEWLAAIGEGLAVIFTALLMGTGGPIALVAGTIAAIAAALTSLYSSNENVRTSIDGFVTTLRDTFLPIWEIIRSNFEDKILPIWNQLVDTINRAFVPALEATASAFRDHVLPAIGPVVDVITGQLIPAILSFADYVAPFIASLVDFFGPVLMHIFEGALRIVQGALESIAGVIKAFTDIAKGDWDALGKDFQTISEGFWTIIAGIFGMNLDQLKALFRQWDIDISNDWNSFWGGIITDQQGYQTTVNGSWNDFWNATADNFQTQLVIPVSTGWVDFWNATHDNFNTQSASLGNGWSSFWQATAQNFQDQLVTPVSRGWTDFWNATQETNNRNSQILSTAWNGLWTGVENFATTVWGRVQTFWQTTLNSLQTMTSAAVDGLGYAWRKLGNFFRDPINWVINVVINDGILGAWNTVMGWIGAPALAAGRIGTIPAFASGGMIQGKGTATSDSILARVSNGEYIVQEKVAGKAKHFLNALNAGQTEALQAAGVFRGGSPYPQYATGGPVEAATAFANSQVGKPYQWGGVGPGGYDCSGFMSAITNVLRGTPPNRRVGSTANFPWGGFHSGADTAFAIGANKSVDGGAGHMAGTLAGLNVESHSGAGVVTGGAARGATNGLFNILASLGEVGGTFVDGGGGGLIEQIVSWWSQVGAKVTALFGAIPTAIPGVGGPIGAGMNAIPGALVGKAMEAIQTKLESMMTSIFVQSVSGTASGIPGSKEVTDQVASVANAFGWGPSNQAEWNALSSIISKESGWNPAAANPTSSARGLFQKMTSINGPIEATVAGQTQWGLNYIKSRYGDPIAALAFHNAHGWYDNGGVLPPVPPINGTGQPEAVLTAPQWDAVMTNRSNDDILQRLDKLIEVMERHGGVATNVNMYGNSDPAESARRALLSIRMARS